MTTFNISKVTALPASDALEQHHVYLVSVGTDKMEIYTTGAEVTNPDNSKVIPVRRVLKESDIQTLIDSAVAGLSSITVVDDITARDALTLSANTQVMVIDATGDSTVSSGGATYI